MPFKNIYVADQVDVWAMILGLKPLSTPGIWTSREGSVFKLHISFQLCRRYDLEDDLKLFELVRGPKNGAAKHLSVDRSFP